MANIAGAGGGLSGDGRAFRQWLSKNPNVASQWDSFSPAQKRAIKTYVLGHPARKLKPSALGAVERRKTGPNAVPAVAGPKAGRDPNVRQRPAPTMHPPKRQTVKPSAAAVRHAEATHDENPQAHMTSGPMAAAPTSVIDFKGLTPPKEDLIDIDGFRTAGATLYDPKLADILSGIRFDQAIKDARQAQEIQGRDQAQALTDIGRWYGQVGGALDTAAKRDAAIGAAAVGSLGDASQSILSSLGGSANPGAEGVGQAGENAVGTLKALSTAQDQYNSDLAPLLEDEAAGAKARQTALGSRQALELATKLADLQSQKGAARAQLTMDLQDKNNAIRDQRIARLLQLREYNAGQKQQGFQNDLALNAAQQSALLSGAKILNLASPSGSSGKPSKVDPSKITQYIAGKFGTRDAQGNPTGVIQPGVSPQTVAQAIKDYLRAQGVHAGNPNYAPAARSAFNMFTQANGQPYQWNPAWNNT